MPFLRFSLNALAGLTALSVLAVAPASAQINAAISYTSFGATLTEDFTNLGTTLSAINEPGWSSSGSALIVSNGSNNTGSAYSFGAAGNTDRALGSIGSNALSQLNQISVYYAWRITNNTTRTLREFQVVYDGEQWRRAANNTAHSLTFDYNTQVATHFERAFSRG